MTLQFKFGGILHVLFLPACGNSAIDNFSLTDQREENVSLDNLKGKPWFATFVLTNCTTVCAPMTLTNDSKWHVLTEYSQDYIAQYAKENFKSFVKNDPSSDQVIPGTRFYFIDKNGNIAHNYDGYGELPEKDIIADIKINRRIVKS